MSLRECVRIIVWIGYVNVQIRLLIIFQYQPISLQYSLQSVEQPITFRLSVVYTSSGISNIIEDNSNINMPYIGLAVPKRICPELRTDWHQ